MNTTHEDYVRNIRNINPNIKILGKYTKSKNKIQYMCLKCKYIGYKIAAELTRNPKCPKCSGKVKLTQEEFENIIQSRNPYIKILSSYIGAKHNIEYKCSICGYVGTVKAYHMLEGVGCPLCCLSHGEKKIAEILSKYNIEYIQQKKYNGLLGINGGQLSYDFFVPKFNLLIEYQGKQHEASIKYFGGEKGFKTRTEHDHRKKKYAQDNNINLLEIWYNEDIEQKLKETLNLETVETAGN